MKRKQRRLTMYAASFGITVIMSLMFAFAWYSYYNKEIIAPFYRKGNWLVLFIYLFNSIIKLMGHNCICLYRTINNFKRVMRR